jgi:hypothetical protein
METETFTFRQVGTMGCEIVGPEGVVAWTVDTVRAALIVTLLNGAEEGNPSSSSARPGAADLTSDETRPPDRR